MGETNQQPIERNNETMISSELQRKSALLLHLLRNLRKPIGLFGSSEELAKISSSLQEEKGLLHSVSLLQPGQETSLAYVFGLLFHLLSISEEEVANADPEQLLVRHLAVLEKNNRLLLIMVSSANGLEQESRQQLMELVSSHPALRLVFMFDGQKEPVLETGELYFFSLSEQQDNNAFQQESRVLQASEAKRLRSIGIALLLLLTVLFGLSFMPETVEQEQAEISRPPEQGVAPQPSVEKNEMKTTKALLPKGVPEPVLAENSILPPVSPATKVEAIQPEPELEKSELPIQETVEPKAAKTKEIDRKQKLKPKEEVVLAEKLLTKSNLKADLQKGEAEVAQTAQTVTKGKVVAAKNKEKVTLIHREAWLLAQGKEKFTLQIMGGSEGDSIARYVERQKDKKPFAYYRSVKRGKDWYPLLYGIYPSKEAAKRAAEKLPAALKKLQPWARSIEAIQIEIGKASASSASN